MASKVQCLRCPDPDPGYKHGNDLAKCQKNIKSDGKPYGLEDLWPLFKGTDTVDLKTKEEARDFIDPVIQSMRDGIAQPWSKGTMEKAAALAFPPSDSSKKQKKQTSIATAMSSLETSASTSQPSTAINEQESSLATSQSSQSLELRGSNGSEWSASITRASDTLSASQSPASQSLALAATASSTSIPTTQSPAQPMQSANYASTPQPTTHRAQSNDYATANQYIHDLAGRLADSEHDNQQRRSHIPEDSRTRLNDQQRNEMRASIIHKFGLRTKFTTPAEGTQLETNRLEIKFPDTLYVYDVEMIRHYDQAGNAILVKKQWDKLKILQHIRVPLPPGQLASPAEQAVRQALHTTRNFWVSDGSMIWSTVSLFIANQPAQVLGPITATHGQALQYENETGDLLPVSTINFRYRQEIDLRRPVAELFFDTTAALYHDSLPDIVQRGLNAFFTKYILERSEPVPAVHGAAQPPQPTFVRLGLNKSYPATGGFILDGRSPNGAPFPATVRGILQLWNRLICSASQSVSHAYP